ncbi:MAG: helix-turn-helix domain-containing protein [Burkholderiaceae bacterium]
MDATQRGPTSTDDNDDARAPGLRERKRARMLDHLTDTATRLFAVHGYAAVTMEQIAAEAEVAKRTLYNHFATKDALLARWIEQSLRHSLTELAPKLARRRSAAARLRFVLDASARWCEAHPEHLLAYLRYRFGAFGAGERPDRTVSGVDIVDTWRALIEQGQRSGELRGDSSATQLAIWFHHLYLAALLRWLTTPGLSLAAELASASRLFFEGALVSRPDGGAAAARRR